MLFVFDSFSFLSSSLASHFYDYGLTPHNLGLAPATVWSPRQLPSLPMPKASPAFGVFVHRAYGSLGLWTIGLMVYRAYDPSGLWSIEILVHLAFGLS